MNKILAGAGIIVVCLFSACADNRKDQDSSLTNTYSQPATITPDSQNLVKPDTTLQVSNKPMTAPLSQPVIDQSLLATSGSGMNPPHGQPGHRCDIAVGAPLSLAPVKLGINTVSTTATPAIQTPAIPAQKTTANVAVPAGMNPQHGQPGHRCDIAVGAPLNSPVAKPGTQTVSQVTNPAAQKTTANMKVPAGMNPQHGQPGHRCDIAVGAPLNSPVTKPAQQPVAPTTFPAPVTDPPKQDSGS